MPSRSQGLLGRGLSKDVDFLASETADILPDVEFHCRTRFQCVSSHDVVFADEKPTSVLFRLLVLNGLGGRYPPIFALPLGNDATEGSLGDARSGQQVAFALQALALVFPKAAFAETTFAEGCAFAAFCAARGPMSKRTVPALCTSAHGEELAWHLAALLLHCLARTFPASCGALRKASSRPQSCEASAEASAEALGEAFFATLGSARMLVLASVALAHIPSAKNLQEVELESVGIRASGSSP